MSKSINEIKAFPNRRSIRLKDWDYSRDGAYFITISTCNKARLFGKVKDGMMHLNACGRIAQDELVKSVSIRKEIELDAFQIMPDHLHAVVFIRQQGRQPKNRANAVRPYEDNEKPPCRMRPRSLSSLVAGFKASVTKQIMGIRILPEKQVWHRGYYDRIIRNEDEWDRIREYIIRNPQQWDYDRNNNPQTP